MTSGRRGGRTWLPALVAPLLLLALFVGSWALNRSALGDDSLPDRPGRASLWRWLVEANNGFWGATPFATGGGGRLLVATLLSAAVVLVIGYAGTWAALRGMRPGSAAFAAFASTWLVLGVSTVLGEIVWWLVANGDRLDEPGAGEAQFASLTNGLQYAAKYGWLAALLATLVWLVVRPPAPRDDASPDGDLGPPESYPSARAGYYRARAYEELHEEARDPLSPRTPPADGPGDPALVSGQDRLAALRAQVEAEATAEEEPATTYVGRRSSGVYSEHEEASPPRRPTGPYGSHRAGGDD